MSTPSSTPRRWVLPGLVARAVSVVVLCVGGLVLLGWWLDVAIVQTVFPHLPRMTANTAAGFVLAGIALGLLQDEGVSRFRRRLAQACSGVVALVGLLTLGEYVFGWDLGIDQLLVVDRGNGGQVTLPGRPSFQTASTLALMGLALGLLDIQPRWGPLPSQLLTVLAILIALLALIGYACGVPSFYGRMSSHPQTAMALHTATLDVLLGMGILCARPRRGLMAMLLSPGVGGTVARRLMLAPVLCPFVLGGLNLACIRGGLYGQELGNWLFSVSNITVLTLVIWWSASQVHRTDIERQAAEATVRRLNAELEQRVLKRTAELAEVNQHLAQKNQENEMFVYSVSHDLRSPLVNLQGFSKELGTACQELHTLLSQDGLPPRLQEQALRLLDQDMVDSLHFIQTGVMRLSSIIDALLRLSRAGRVDYHWQHIDLQTMLRRIVESMRATIDERRATVTMKPLPPAWGDPTALEQVFANLIGNALDYLDPGRPGRIEVGSSNAHGGEEIPMCLYYVRDNGLGIPEAYQHKIFQAFQRVHPDASQGEGIGLAVVRRVLDRHQGKIWVESEPGLGSTFFVALPRPPADDGSADGQQERAAVSTR